MRWTALAVLAACTLFILSPRACHAFDVVEVSEGIHAIVGEKGQRSPKNLANNATFGLIVTGEGAVLVDPGGSWKGAEALHAEIRKITDKPVRYVIDTGGQDHRWLGNGYWRRQGAVIVASNAAIADQKARASMQLSMLDQLLGGSLDGTEPDYADLGFDGSHSLTLGGTEIEIRHAGHAHTPGDVFVWVPSKKVVFAGDIVFTERLLGVLPVSKSKTWIEAFEAMAALQPEHVVPGHGAPTTLARAKADTLDYLVQLRAAVTKHTESGGDMNGSAKVDQSAFSRLEQFDVLAGRNAQAVFAEMEFE